jgi:hypothetical protein
MVELLRTGPGILLMETTEQEQLKLKLGGPEELEAYSLMEAFSLATEGETIVLFVSDDERVLRSSQDKSAVILRDEPAVILSGLVNSGAVSLVRKTKLVSRTIIMRTMGNMERVFDELLEDYHGIEGSIMEFINSNLEQGVIIALTDKSLNRQVNLGDIYMEKCLLISDNYFTVFKELRSNALKYLNSGLNNKVWYEMDIRIYDMYGAFKLHFERLMNVLTELEMGIVLGSSWSKDYPKMLLAVDVYSVRFFTFYEPSYIKKILLGMEYVDDGTRIVDYDLYMGRKKISWRDLTKDKKMKRDDLGMRYRRETISNLTPQELTRLYDMEKRVMETRKDS